jgi:hypothetical protein
LAVFSPLFAGIRDPRVAAKVSYPLECLLFTGLLLFLCRLGARRQVGCLLRQPRAVEKLRSLFDVRSAPHGDTLEDLVSQLSVDEVQECVCRIVEALIRKKVLYPFRLLDQWFVIAIDGSGTFSFTERHCPYCLTQTQHGKIIYFHNILEAKLVTPSGFAFSIMTEFIENPHEKPTKQDCELKALYRLAKRLKERFPKLPLLLSLDGLYACGPVFDLCRRNGWHFMAVLKDHDIPSINEEFESLAPLAPQDRLSLRTGKDLSTAQEFRWVNEISYIDDAKREHAVSVIECVETKLSRKRVRAVLYDPSVGTPGDETDRAVPGAGALAPPSVRGQEPAQPTAARLPCRLRRRRRAREAGQEKYLQEVLTTKKHKWVTDIMVNKKTVEPLADDGGRLRWKVENEGFNVQKNGGYGLEHVYSNNPNSAKVYYLLLQMAHILAQLMGKGSLVQRLFPKGFGSAKNLALALLEAWRNAPAAIPTAAERFTARFQIRFDSS